MNSIRNIIHGQIFHIGWKRASIALIGFILSPLTWWNDLFINFPIAYGFAWAAGRLLDTAVDIHKWLFVDLFILGYFLTNLGGLLMIHHGLFRTHEGHWSSWSTHILISIAYSLLIVAFFGLSPESSSLILPSWVKH